MKIAVTGATGQLGRLVLEKLKNENVDVVALARNTEKAQDLGVEVRAFDYDQREHMDDALAGVDRLLLVSSNEIGKRLQHHESVIHAAKKAGVSQLVFTSLVNVDHSTLNLAGEYIDSEKSLQASGVPFTILRNAWYTENYTSSAANAVAGGAFIGSAGDGKISAASREDLAEAAVAVLLDTDHLGKVYELAGDQAFTLTDLAAAISEVTGKDIPYRNLSEGEYKDALVSHNVPEGFAAMIASWDVSASKGDLYSEDKTLSQLIGRPTTPLIDTVKAALS
ncbi:SDR family oxidoreductase [Sphingobacterium corticibacter]|uniref:NAD(P)-dependent oxidoreductase n=1 Tax=Sphingobacterium corticibacter TaxID=2171749 RepID=A0A2T8HMB7_9SPHI|nr:SDR family oxidoreductase [Sphingobacterium corticibacter]PVH26575.1 NAD(P)-dependent oxidoreductase [Sphingobacterium corticibacter]